MRQFATILLFFLGAIANAQQDPLYSQYMFNTLSVNPAYAGGREAFTAMVTGRLQWPDMDGAPQTLTASLHTPLANQSMGLGILFYDDATGPYQDIGLAAAYAYRVRLGSGRLSFGLQGGFKHVNIDWNKVILFDPGDVAGGLSDDKIFPDFSAGIYYQTDKYFLGISSMHLLEPDYGLVTIPGQTVYSNLIRHFYGMAGYALTIAEDFVFKPSALVRYTKGAPLQVDINTSFLLSNLIWFGVSYRTDRSLVLITELILHDKFRFGYSYDMNFNELKTVSKGSHEVMISYDVGAYRNRMVTPRYF